MIVQSGTPLSSSLEGNPSYLTSGNKYEVWFRCWYTNIQSPWEHWGGKWSWFCAGINKCPPSASGMWNLLERWNTKTALFALAGGVHWSGTLWPLPDVSMGDTMSTLLLYESIPPAIGCTCNRSMVLCWSSGVSDRNAGIESIEMDRNDSLRVSVASSLLPFGLMKSCGTHKSLGFEWNAGVTSNDIELKASLCLQG